MTEKRTPNPLPELSVQDAELLSAYIDDMLPPIERADLESRLENEAFLRDELAAMQQTVAWVNQLPRLKAPRDFTITAADVQRVEKQEQPKKVLRPNFAWTLAGTAAAVVVLLVGFSFVLLSGGGMMGSAPMEAENIALQSTTIAPASEGDGVAVDMEQQVFPTGTAIPTLAMTETSLRMGVGVTAMPPMVVDISEETVEDEAVVEEADMDDSVAEDSQAIQESQNGQAVSIGDVQITATALSNLFMATPTAEANAPSLFLGDAGSDSDKTASAESESPELATGGSAESSEESADDGTMAQSSVDSVPEMTQTYSNTLPNTGGQPNFMRLGQILLAWLIQVILEFVQ